MTNSHDHAEDLVRLASDHVVEAERLLAKVDLEDMGASIDPLRVRIRRCVAELSVLSGLG